MTASQKRLGSWLASAKKRSKLRKLSERWQTRPPGWHPHKPPRHPNKETTTRRELNRARFAGAIRKAGDTRGTKYPAFGPTTSRRYTFPCSFSENSVQRCHFNRAKVETLVGDPKD